jgi:hypothetical protein
MLATLCARFGAVAKSQASVRGSSANSPRRVYSAF